jgi:vacuolar-type H+-ATPase subunit E/Vma4
MNLTLTTEEEELLRELLSEHQRELFREISRADHRDFKHNLQRQERLLESVLSKLSPVHTG